MNGVPYYLKDYYKYYCEQKRIFIHKIHDTSETIGYVLSVDCYKALDEQKNKLSFLEDNKDRFVDILGKEYVEGIYKKTKETISSLRNMIENDAKFIEDATFNRWKELYGFTPERLASLNAEQLTDAQQLFEELMPSVPSIGTVAITDKTLAKEYFSEVLQQLGPWKFADEALYRHLMINLTDEELIHADKDFSEFINDEKNKTMKIIEDMMGDIYEDVESKMDGISFIKHPMAKMYWWYLKLKNYTSSVDTTYLYGTLAVLVLLTMGTLMVYYRYKRRVPLKQYHSKQKAHDLINQPVLSSNPFFNGSS